MTRKAELFKPRALTQAERDALKEYDRGEWPVRDWSIAVTMRRSGYGDAAIRGVLGYVPNTDVPLEAVIAGGMKAIR